MRLLDIILLALVQLIWGANYAVQKDAIAAFPPLLLVGIGYAIIALALTPFTRRTHSPQWKLALLAFFSCTLPTGMTFFGLAHCPVSLGTLLMQMQVPFGIAVAWALGRGKPDARNIAGIIVALIGAALCFSLWYKLLMRVPAEKILPFLLLMPAAGVLAGWLMLGEALSTGLLFGGAVIILGLAIILWPRKAEFAAIPNVQAEAVGPPEI
jgi:drug/metabolite transporter (DMT)-like permease